MEDRGLSTAPSSILDHYCAKEELYEIIGSFALLCNNLLACCRDKPLRSAVRAAFRPCRGREKRRQARLVHFDGDRHVEAVARRVSEGVPVHQSRARSRWRRAVDESNLE